MVRGFSTISVDGEQRRSWARLRVLVDAVSRGFARVVDHPDTSFPYSFVCTLMVRNERELGGYQMSWNEFRQPVAVDTAPRGSRCEWCGKPAEVQLTAIGGNAHNDSGVFCRPCGEDFRRAVAQSATLGTSTNQGVQI